MSVLENLFDAGTGGRCDKWRHYLEIYERYFQKFVGKKCTCLEIGVWRGGFLDILQKYLGPDARIVGVDIDPACAKLRKEGREIYIGDQSDVNFLRQVIESCGPFDIIIDDGGHVADQQIVSFLSLFPALKEGGVYVAEDLHTAFWQGYQDSRYGLNFYDFAKGLVDKMSLWHVDQRLLERYQKPYDQRQGNVTMRNFALNEIYGIHFYDSVAVFEKRRKMEPIDQVK